LIHSEQTDHRLEAVAQRFGVPIVGRHSALGDALTTAEILSRQLDVLAKRQFVTLGDVLGSLRRVARTLR
jgi:DNA polymerase-3 subunit epsilon